MPITAFSVGASRTINLGNFESLRVEANVTMEVPKDGAAEMLHERAQTELRLLLEQTYKAMTRKGARIENAA